MDFPSVREQRRAGGTAHARDRFGRFPRADELRQRRVKLRHRVAERFCERVAVAARVLRRGRAAAGQNAGGGFGCIALRAAEQEAALCLPDPGDRRADPAGHAVRFGAAAQRSEHGRRLPAARVDAPLAVRLCDEPQIAENAAHRVGRVSREERLRRRHVAVVMCGRRREIRQVAAPVSGREQLAPELLVALEHEHRAGLFQDARSGARRHQAGRAAADNYEIRLFHTSSVSTSPDVPN